MQTAIRYSKRISSLLIMLMVVLSTAINCTEDDDDGYGDNNGNNGGNNGGNSNGSTVTIRYYSFSPATITMTAGTTVTWRNTDEMAHTVTSDEGLFDSGLIDPNESFSLKFDSTGTFDYHCTPHPEMTATVVVN